MNSIPSTQDVGMYSIPSTQETVYVLFEVIATDANNQLPYGRFECRVTDQIGIDKLRDCKSAILVPYYEGNTFSIFHRPNFIEGS